MSASTVAAPDIVAEPPEPVESPPPPVVPTGARARVVAGLLLRWPALVLCACVGTVVVGCSYRLSYDAAPANLYYTVFWVGLLTAVVPVTIRIIVRPGSRASVAAGLVLIGFLTWMPKFLRNPDRPLYHDEYAHWREAVDVAGSGHLFAPNTLIPIVEFFPGTSALTTGLASLTGLSLWTSGIAIICVMHILGLLGMYVLAETHLLSMRAGVIAAVIYGINPSAIYFDTQYAYESIAINVFIWLLALTSLASRATTGRRRAQYFVGGAVCAAMIVVTHHLTIVFTLACLGIVSATHLVRRLYLRRRFGARPPWGGAWWGMLATTAGFAALWVTFVATPTIAYLSPYFGGSVGQLRSMADKPDKSNSRQVLAASVQPMWERLATALVPLLLATAAVAALYLLRRKNVRLSSGTWGLMMFGLIYFPSVLFILVPSGAEGARRSWGFTYVGLALIVALVITHRHSLPRWTRRAMATPVLIALFVIMMVGNVGGGLNDPYRFPGQFRWGTDTNSASPEAATVGRFLENRYGRVRVVTDFYTRLQLAAYGGLDIAKPSAGFPAWELTQTDTDPSPALARMLISSDYDFLVVDKRMGEQPAFNGHNFGSGDPLLGQATPAENLDRLDHVDWATRIMSTENLRVYRLHLDTIASQP